MSKDKPEQKQEAVKPATLCIAITHKDGGYLVEEVHLAADGKAISRKPTRPALKVRKLAAGYACIDMEEAVARWQQEGLLP